MTVGNEGRHTCDSSEWYTPSPYVEAAREVMRGIDLDPASHAEANVIVKADRFYTEQQNGLAQSWFGRCFINPPGKKVAEFWTKFIAEIEAERVTQAIWVGYSLEQLQTLQSLPGKTPLDFAMCVPRRRIAFVENAAKKAERLTKIDAENFLRRVAGRKLMPRSEAGSPSHANYITYYGHAGDAFERVFSTFGRVRLLCEDDDNQPRVRLLRE